MNTTTLVAITTAVGLVLFSAVLFGRFLKQRRLARLPGVFLPHIIIAGNYKQACLVADSYHLTPHDWNYAMTPQALQGRRRESPIFIYETAATEMIQWVQKYGFTNYTYIDEKHLLARAARERSKLAS